MTNVIQETTPQKLEAFVQQHIHVSHESHLGFIDDTYKLIAIQAEASKAFKEWLSMGSISALSQLIGEEPDAMIVIIAHRLLVGFSMGFQYAKALYEQKELEKL